MKAAAIVLSVCLAVTAAGAATPTGLVLEVSTGEARVGGEDVPSAVPIPSLPFVDTGNTCGYVDDYDAMCPYGAMAPDVVYSYVSPHDACVDINLCNSFYDTKVMVYEHPGPPGNLHACNDDHPDCIDPPVYYTSWLEEVPLTAGQTYYIVVDGYGWSCGDYVLDITECGVGCDVECPPEGTDEGEGPCYDGYEDGFNGGCVWYPFVFSEPPPSDETIVICGLGGDYNGNTLRDTDWYLLDLTCDPTTVEVCVESEFQVTLGLVDLSPGCDNITGYYASAIADPCEPACLTETLPAGEWAVVVSSMFTDAPCDSEYVLTIDGYDSCVPVEKASWGTIKGFYR